MSEKLVLEKREHILFLTLNDPATRNALNGNDLFDAFEDAVELANSDLDIRVVILSGAGVSFSSGGNVHDMRERKGMFGGTSQEIAEQYRTGIQRMPKAFMKLDVPAIAAVNGAAIGAGLDLACMCDMRIASDKAFFAESFVRLGLVPGDGGTWFLPRAVGYAKAAEMAFTGDRISAEEALRIGLVSAVVPADRLIDAAVELAKRITVNPPHALRWTKRLLKDSWQQRLDTVLDMAAAYQSVAHHTEDHMEAVICLGDKSLPNFKGS